MINGVNGIKINPMQLLRFEKYPIRINDNLIVIDNLEEGTLKFYEYTSGILNVQKLFVNDNNKNAMLIAQISINDEEQNGNICIERIFCCYGYEALAVPMIYQVVNFVKFYECCKSVVISENERENWFLYAGGILSDFHKRDSKYVYQVR